MGYNLKTNILIFWNLVWRIVLKWCLRLRYLAIICILMILYSNSTNSANFVKGLWMSIDNALCTEINQYMAYRNNVLYWTGIWRLIFIFIGSFIVRACVWLVLGWFAYPFYDFIYWLYVILFFDAKKKWYI